MLRDALILGFDTSAAHCAAALVLGDRVLANRYEEMSRGQAERLFPLLEEVLAEAGKSWADLAAIGVGVGPGNFTGIRISVSAARGLALALAIPAVGVTVLEAQAFGQTAPAISSIDARRDGYYIQSFGMKEPLGPTLMRIEDIPPPFALGQHVCLGDGSAEIAQALGGKVAEPRLPLAEAIARIAGERMVQTNLRPAPLYLKKADAAPSREQPPVIL